MIGSEDVENAMAAQRERAKIVPVDLGVIHVEKPASVRARIAERECLMRHEAWLQGYEACKRGEQMHSPYRSDR